MATRAKFVCSSVEDYGQSKKVNLAIVYDPQANGEDKNFTKASPSGHIWLTIDNPAAACQFKPGFQYYVDFTEAPAESRG